MSLSSLFDATDSLMYILVQFRYEQPNVTSDDFFFFFALVKSFKILYSFIITVFYDFRLNAEK